VSPRSQRLRIAFRGWRISLRVRSAGIGWRVIEVIMRLALILGRRHPELVVLKEAPPQKAIFLFNLWVGGDIVL